MPALVELKASINKVLENNFNKTTIYSRDTKEGFKRPAFFTKVIPITSTYDTKNYTSNKQMVVINYFSKNGTELENLVMHDAIKKAFGMTLKVNQRSFLIQNVRSEVVDTVLQFKFDLDYLTVLEKEEAGEKMRILEMKIEKE